jgi:hypothetical protein
MTPEELLTMLKSHMSLKVKVESGYDVHDPKYLTVEISFMGETIASETENIG